MIRMISPDGASRADLSEEHQLDCYIRTDGFKDIYGRMAWDDVAPTITGGCINPSKLQRSVERGDVRAQTITGGCINPSKGRFLHPQEHRAITLREAALLQSFPADYELSDFQGPGWVATPVFPG